MRRETAKGVVGCVRMDSLLSADKWQGVAMDEGETSDQQVGKAGKRGSLDLSGPKAAAAKKRKLN